MLMIARKRLRDGYETRKPILDEEYLLRFCCARNITPREQEILKCILLKGLSNREIALEMTISEKTVKNHISNLYMKCDVSNTRQLIALLFR